MPAGIKKSPGDQRIWYPVSAGPTGYGQSSGAGCAGRSGLSQQSEMGPVELDRRVVGPDLFLKGTPFWLLVENRFRGKVEAEVPAGRYWEKWSFQIDFEGRATRFVPGWDAEQGRKEGIENSIRVSSLSSWRLE